MAVVPAPLLTVPLVTATAKTYLGRTLKAAGPGKYAVAYCHKTSRHYGRCAFTMRFTSKESGKKFLCHGTVLVRNVNGLEAAYQAGVVCNGKKVT